METVKSLLKAAQSGDAAAFAKLYSMYAAELYRYALKYLGNPYDAEDAVSESTLRVFKNLQAVRNADSFKAYYFRVLANCAKTTLGSRAKRETRFAVVFDAEPDKADVETQTVLKMDIDAALRTLDNDTREIVLLSAVGGFTSREIAKITGCTAGAVRSKLSRTLTKLREVMECGGEA